MAKVITKKETATKAAESPMGDKVEVKKPKRMKNLGEVKTPTIKVNLAKPPVEEKQEEKQPEKEKQKEVVEEVKKEKEEKVETKKEETEKPVLEEITDEKIEEEIKEEVDTVKETIKEAVEEAQETGQKLPENIQKVVDFMNETGGDLNDYVKLNQDYSKMNDSSLLREYYQQTKPHLNNDEINFLMEDSFSYDEEIDEAIDIKRKKLAFKEQVANAKSHLDGRKSKYYAEIKAGSKLSPDQQKAIDFFNRYNKENEESQKVAKEQQSYFLNKTNEVFNNKFKGFEYNVGEKKFRYNVKDVNDVKDTQSDLNNFVSKFLNKRNMMENANGYHKSLFTAMNADAIANHFYEQGKADGIKESISKTKNLDMTPRQGHETVDLGAGKARVISGDNTSNLKFKLKNY
tara:strand:+ start:623 stop:1831 length:1209 start_codon:yes stop_codon:yes gene_type:complete